MKHENFELTFIVVINSHNGMINYKKYFDPAASSFDKTQWILMDKSAESIDEDPAFKEEDYKKAIEFFDALKNVKRIQMPASASDNDCYNEAFDYIEGQYVCYSNQEVIYNRYAVEKVLEASALNEGAGLIALRNKLYNKRRHESRRRKNHIAEIELIPYEESLKIPFFAPAYFIKKDLLLKGEFNSACDEEGATLVLFNKMKEEGSYIAIKNVFAYYYGTIRRGSNNYYGADNKLFYTEAFKKDYLPLLESFASGKVPYWFQRVIYYQIYFRYNCNFGVRDKALLDKEEVEEFFKVTGKLLAYIDDELIMDFNPEEEQFSPQIALRDLFCYLKYDGDIKKLDRHFTIEDTPVYEEVDEIVNEMDTDKDCKIKRVDNRVIVAYERTLFYYQCGIRHNFARHQQILIRAFNFKDGNFIIDGAFFLKSLLELNPGCIYAKVNGKKRELIETGIYALEKVFAVAIESKYTFQLQLPAEEVRKDNTEIAFYLNLNGEEIKLPLDFPRPPSKLSNNMEHSYWGFTRGYTLIYENQALKVKRFNDVELEAREKLYLKEAKAFFNEKVKGKRNIHKRLYYKLMTGKVRSGYFKEKKKNPKRRIWLYFDKLYKAGDNGEYLFRYAMDNCKDDGIEHYYIINKDAQDKKKLIEDYPNNILDFNSYKCRLYALIAENVVATHPDIIEFLGYNGRFKPVVKDLFNANLICIAHGVTIQKNADYQNRIYDNTNFYTTSSQYEVQHLLQPVYGYDKDQVALTGMARFDGLVNRDKKQVLITPTWRRNIIGTARRNSTRQYNPAFKESSYFKIYNSLINDKRIIDVAKKTGYRLIFLLHPAMSAQIDDYDRNDSVELIQATGNMNYEKILTESSLMITDYSGIHYDFGYQRKPVIYYQPKEVPMRFEEGGMKFATQGFGPVCDEYEEAVSLICEYMENNCIMPEKFKKNADDFFAFDDHNNCQRIYKAIYDWTEKRKEEN